MEAPTDPGPPDRGGDRPDMSRRGRLDPGSPPAGYYGAPDELPLRTRVHRALAAARAKLLRRR